jgi:hypothetical protein
MTIYYLYLKTHLKSGLRYLGQTSNKNPYQYQGSGVDWKIHLAMYGYDVNTEILLTTTSIDDRNLMGRYYSQLWNVTSAVDDFGNKIYANRIAETGGGGGMTSALAKEIANKPGAREKNSNRAKIAMNRPDVKQRHTNAMRNISEKIRNIKLNPQIFTFSHSSGITEICTRNALIQKYQLIESNMSFLIKGTRKTHRGWKILS